MRRLFSREVAAIFSNGLLFRNPMLIGALGLFPIVAAGYSLKRALELSLLFLLISIPVNLLLCLLGMLVPQWARPGLVLFLSAAVYIPAGLLTAKAFPGALAELGIAAALMVCNSAVYSRADEYAPSHVAVAVLADALGTAVGFAAVVCLISAARELLLTGQVHVSRSIGATGGAALPFVGFLLLGFLAALVQWMNYRRSEKTSGRRRRG